MNTTGEGDATITATILRLSGDPYTAGAERVATTVIKDNDRVELDITPQPLRKTLLTWSAPTGTADGYFIQYRKVGQAFSTSRQHDHGTLREYEINLDQIHQVTNSEGQMQWRALGDADYRVQGNSLRHRLRRNQGAGGIQQTGTACRKSTPPGPEDEYTAPATGEWQHSIGIASLES